MSQEDIVIVFNMYLMSQEDLVLFSYLMSQKYFLIFDVTRRHCSVFFKKIPLYEREHMKIGLWMQ